jgi:penicillin-binding protein 1A
MRRVIKRVAVASAVLGLVAGVALAAWLAWVLRDIPDARMILEYHPERATEILDRNGFVLGNVVDEEFRIWVPLAEIADSLQKAVLAAEDDTFFRHKGVNFQATWEALKADLRSGRFVRGGSTITQQLVKNVFLTRDKTLARKLREVVLARRIERLLPKERILELYLNEVEWGPKIYGAEAAARYYFDRRARDLSLAQSAMLAGLLMNPSRFSPYAYRERAEARAGRVLRLMRVDRYITPEALEEAQAERLVLRAEIGGPRFPDRQLPCALRSLARHIRNQYDRVRLFRVGLSIPTTLDAGLQSYLDGHVGQFRGLAPEGRPNETPAGFVVATDGVTVRAVLCAWNPDGSAAAAEFLNGQDRGSRYRYRYVAVGELAWDAVLVRS